MFLVYFIDLFKGMTMMLETQTKTIFSVIKKKQAKHCNATALVGVVYQNTSVYILYVSVLRID